MKEFDILDIKLQEGSKSDHFKIISVHCNLKIVHCIYFVLVVEVDKENNGGFICRHLWLPSDDLPLAVEAISRFEIT